MTPILTGVVASGISGHLYDGPYGAMDALATITVPSGGATEVIFNGLPQGYRHLRIYALAKHNAAGTGLDNCTMQLNGVTSSIYTTHFIRGDGSGTPSATNYTGLTNFSTAFWCPASGNANLFGAGIIDIYDYADTTKTTTMRSIAGGDQNGSGTVSISSSLFNSTDAIKSIRLFGATFLQNSSFELYGIK